MLKDELLALARSIDPPRAHVLEQHFAAWGEEHADAAALATVVVSAFPAFAQLADSRPSIFADLCREGWRSPRTRAGLVASLLSQAGDLRNGDGARAGLRVAVQYEKLRL